MMETLNQKAPSLPFDFVSLQLQYLVLHLPETKESFQINLTIKKVTTLLTAILKLKLRLISNGYLKKTFGKTPGHGLFVCLLARLILFEVYHLQEKLVRLKFLRQDYYLSGSGYCKTETTMKKITSLFKGAQKRLVHSNAIQSK